MKIVQWIDSFIAYRFIALSNCPMNEWINPRYWLLITYDCFSFFNTLKNIIFGSFQKLDQQNWQNYKEWQFPGLPLLFLKLLRLHLKLFYSYYTKNLIDFPKSIGFCFNKRHFNLLLFLFLFLFLFWLTTLKNGRMIISPSQPASQLLFHYYFVTISLLFIHWLYTVKLYVNRLNASLDTWFKQY